MRLRREKGRKIGFYCLQGAEEREGKTECVECALGRHEEARAGVAERARRREAVKRICRDKAAWVT